MSKMKIIGSAILMLAFGWCVAVSAEMRTWNFKTGEQLEAEFVKQYFGKIVLKDAAGKEWTLKEEDFVLSDEDKEYLALEEVPELKLEFKKSITQKNFTNVRYAEGRPPEDRASFGAKVQQKGTGDYPFELTVEFFAIGKEIKGERYILLDRASDKFTLTKENGREFEFYSNRIVRLTDMWKDNETYSERGEQYFGFLIVVKDKRGKVVAMDASNDWLMEHLDHIEERMIGNYMDETCTRTYPTRPKSYIASRASGRE
ncbi:MAG: hypothetical protein JXR40_00445 [Pontiellaceae bacterium]|nr:hypothetical protein [Pontiellaceae bacterium]